VSRRTHHRPARFRRSNAMRLILRTSLLLLIVMFAPVSTMTHAAQLQSDPVATEHQHHPSRTAPQKHENPCCAGQACVGCAVVPLSNDVPLHVLPMPFETAARGRNVAMTAHASLPAVPPPRL
jgi:hypothetical protein